MGPPRDVIVLRVRGVRGVEARIQILLFWSLIAVYAEEEAGQQERTKTVRMDVESRVTVLPPMGNLPNRSKGTEKVVIAVPIVRIYKFDGLVSTSHSRRRTQSAMMQVTHDQFWYFRRSDSCCYDVCHADYLLLLVRWIEMRSEDGGKQQGEKNAGTRHFFLGGKLRQAPKW